ncbi:MAG: thermonuclease family protein [Patescibacteria group bacterium]
MVLVKIEKKSLVFLAGGIFLLLIGFLLGRVNIDNKSSLPLPVSETFKVTRVIDGDTIEIEGGERVRYLGIDTPETVDPRKPVQCFGVEASRKNKELVEGKNVRLEKDISDKDKYGRLLRYVYVDPSTGSGQVVFVNLELVKLGFATSYTYPPDVKHQTEILAAEAEARRENRGLWSACPLASPTVSSPSPSGKISADCNIKGNISSSGEKIYHLQTCGSYAKTKIDESRGERWFCSEEEAKAAGWRKALNCP